MATCKECIHREICIVYGCIDDEVCLYFRNKANYAEVKHGKWTLHPDGSGTCNLCGRTQKSVWDFDNTQGYCGKCGADMRGVKW